MEGLLRIVRLHRELRQRRGPVSARVLQEQLECSRPTLFRTLAHLRDQLGAPLINVPGHGYAYDRNLPEFELPGFWLSADELQALVVMDDLLVQLEPGILREHVRPLRAHIDQLLAKSNRTHRPPPLERIRLLRQHGRRVLAANFAVIAGALLERRQLRIRYEGRSRGRTSAREVSPQRLVHYRDNWYLDAWCHLAEDLRVFSLDRVRAAESIDQVAIEVPHDELDRAFTASYGIFAGAAHNIAKLLFTPTAARWVADEHWHPNQSGQFRTDGSYELTVPYGDARELVKDVLRHGADVLVLEPRALASAVETALLAALRKYRPDTVPPEYHAVRPAASKVRALSNTRRAKSDRDLQQ